MQKFAIVALILCCAAEAGDDFKLGDANIEASGIKHYTLTSPFQSQPTTLRILCDENAAKSESKRVLFILPVEPKEESRFKDGMLEAAKLELHKKFGFIVVAPSFAQLPWYCDHPTDEGMRQESHFLKAVLPAIDQLFPSKKTTRLLLGFSKSGWGAYSLILRNPDLFEAASAWDAPLMKNKPDQFGMGPIFSTQQNFEQYQISSLLKSKGEAFKHKKRLALSGYGNFRVHTQDTHALLESLSIPHDYADGPQVPHTWDSGWMEASARYLDAMSK
jgi:hypothetical protein